MRVITDAVGFWFCFFALIVCFWIAMDTSRALRLIFFNQRAARNLSTTKLMFYRVMGWLIAIQLLFFELQYLYCFIRGK
jgi:hypothetical protein